MKPRLAQIFTVITFGWCAIASAQISGLYNTGVSNGVSPPFSGGGTLNDTRSGAYTVSDPHYQLVSVPGGTTSINIATSVGGVPIPPWLPDDTLSTWIGPANSLATSSPFGATGVDGVGGLYDYRTTFTLASAGVFTITGQWAVDNRGSNILYDGTSTGNTIPNDNTGWTTWHAFSISGTGTQGVHTLDFLVYNNPDGEGDPTPTGLRVEFVPEPSTFTLLAVGAISLLAWRRGRRLA